MDLTTSARVLTLLGTPNNPSAVQLLEMLIDAVSARVERALDRWIETKRRTEYFDVFEVTQRVFLKAYPVSTVHRVWNDQAREFGIDDDTVDTNVNAASAAAGTALYVADTTGFAVDDTISIGEGTARDEENTVSALPSGTQITVGTALTYTHTSAQADEVHVSPTSDCLDADSYAMLGGNEGSDPGILWFETPLDPGARALKVSYTGGMATSAATFLTNYPDFEWAVVQQVAHEYQMREAPGLTNRPVHGGGGETLRAPGDADWLLRYGQFIPELAWQIRQHRRRTG